MFTKVQLLLLALVTAAAGCLVAFYLASPELEQQLSHMGNDGGEAASRLDHLHEGLTDISAEFELMNGDAQLSLDFLSQIRPSIAALAEQATRDRELYEQQRQAVDAAVVESGQQTQAANDTLDTMLSKLLGKPVGQTFADSATVKVYSLQEAGYRGYMAKVKLHDPKAVKLVLSGDKVGHRGETTSASAKRTQAVLAVNAGGFARGDDGLLYPMGITVVDGEIKTYYRTDLSMIGFNSSGNLVGGDVSSREEIADLDIRQGATFVPTLLKGGKKLDIPSRYAGRKEPRTLIGHFSNGDLLFVVIDGRQKESSGVTLEEAQDKLLEFNVRDAYNLDGGGSSSFVYNGKVMNSPSDGQERRVVSNFVIVP